jgi:FKBP-type peptidyl-prolyl cis-trans isomerase
MPTRSTLLAALLASVVLLASGAAAARPAPRTARPSQDAERNREAGEAFRAKNRAAEGVVTLASGLQYEVLKAGRGPRPTLEDTVVVHYRGTLVDGTEFGSSYRTGRPGTFPLRASIAGWREALQLMPAGSKWRIVIPPHLAYGTRGGGGAIGPDATLVYETELVSVVDRERKAAAASPDVKALEVSFKLDPRLTRSLYLGDRWVSPPTFSAPAQGKSATVMASVRGVDASGKRVGIDARWKAADPGMVQVSRLSAGDVNITVTRPGASTVAVAFGGITKELGVKASRQGDALAVVITQ